jgi:glycosyltransferase involved in cell wall biosynthesis
MKQCDYLSVVRSDNIPSLSSFLHELNSCKVINEAYSYINKRVQDWVPCITDEYSRLRYATFFLEELGIVYEQPLYFYSSNKILMASLHEVLFALLAKKHGSADTLFKYAGTQTELASLLKIITNTKIPVSPGLVLDQMGKSPHIDSLVRDVVRSHISVWDRDNFCHLVLKKIDSGKKELKVTLDILAEHRLKILQDEKLEQLLNGWDHDHEVYNALLRYTGECDVKAVIPFLDKKLQAAADLPIFKVFAICDVLAQIGNKKCLSIMDRVKALILSMQNHPAASFITEYTELASQEISLREDIHERVEKNPAVVVQCAFYGDIARPGQSGGGGLATLLNMLGNSFARSDKWDHIYTLFLFPLEADFLNRRLIETSDNNNHHIIRVPVSFPAIDLSNQFLIHEYEIMRAVRRALDQHGIDPAVFHIRYSDNASLAAAILSEKLNKRLVFTLTPDPHRTLTDDDGKLLSMNEEDALDNVNKVYIADTLVERANGIILIGHDKKNDQIIPYFPRLLIKQELRNKPLDIVPEGIDMTLLLKNGESYEKFLELLTDHKGLFRLDSACIKRPIILNVGRLNRIKGQHLLLDAWAHSRLPEIYNLVLVGGNLDNPDKNEQMILEHIETTMSFHSELKGRFCHLGALSNREIRILERTIMEKVCGKMPNVYACSSIKEEFGISILEAMAAGFLAVAPVNGGVSSYIENGKNGYLIETHSMDSIMLGMESVLLSKDVSSVELKAIADRGKTYVRKVFDIDEVAKIFSRFYNNIIEGI